MTRLLVSVRSAAEAQIALDSGVDFIDIKEPDRGSLGAADPETVEAIAQQVDGRRALSAALGELLSAVELPQATLARLQYAKFGLSGCARRANWSNIWAEALARLPASVGAVAVAYADCAGAQAPEPAEVLRQAVSLGCRALLLDTYDKSHGSLLTHCDLPAIGRLIRATQSHGLLCVVAGSLGLVEIEAILPLAPDLLAVRGAMCRGNRRGELDAERVQALAMRLTIRSSSLVEPTV